MTVLFLSFVPCIYYLRTICAIFMLYKPPFIFLSVRLFVCWILSWDIDKGPWIENAYCSKDFKVG